jgi:hypothetical protein
MVHPNGPKNKETNKASTANETSNEQLKTGGKKENSKDEQDSVPVDPDAQKYFDAEDEDQELRSDNNSDIPL